MQIKNMHDKGFNLYLINSMQTYLVIPDRQTKKQTSSLVSVKKVIAYHTDPIHVFIKKTSILFTVIRNNNKKQPIMIISVSISLCTRCLLLFDIRTQ